MRRAEMIVHKEFTVGNVDGNMFGFFMEYGEGEIQRGIYYPDQTRPGTEESGFRRDIMDLFRELNPGVIRGPGGNNMASFRWKDSIGPRQHRPVTVNYAHSEPGRLNLDSNKGGIDDLAALTEELKCECMMVVNLCDNTIQDVMEEVEYCTLPGGTRWSDARIKNGYSAPHKIAYWYLGNEVDGEWIYGQHTPDSYGHKAKETAKMIRTICPDAKVVLCGTSNPYVPTYPQWDQTVLEWAFDYVDLLSVHYIRNANPSPQHGNGERPIGVYDLGQFGVELEDFIKTTEASIRVVQAKRKSHKRIGISIDEWGEMGLPACVPEGERFAERASFTEEETAELLRSGLPVYFAVPNYLLHAVVYGMYMIIFMNHADIIDVVCKCFIDDSLLMLTEKGYLKMSAFYPFAYMSRYGRGVVLRQQFIGTNYETEHYDKVPAVYVTAVYQEKEGMVTVFAVNVDAQEKIVLANKILGFGEAKLVRHTQIWDEHPLCGNTFQNPERLLPRECTVHPEAKSVILPPLSWTMLRYDVKAEVT